MLSEVQFSYNLRLSKKVWPKTWITLLLFQVLINFVESIFLFSLTNKVSPPRTFISFSSLKMPSKHSKVKLSRNLNNYPPRYPPRTPHLQNRIPSIPTACPSPDSPSWLHYASRGLEADSSPPDSVPPTSPLIYPIPQEALSPSHSGFNYTELCPLVSISAPVQAYFSLLTKSIPTAFKLPLPFHLSTTQLLSLFLKHQLDHIIPYFKTHQTGPRQLQNKVHNALAASHPSCLCPTSLLG